MRRPWIKIEVSTPDKPEVCAIATRLRIDPDAVVGKLIRLWAWAESNRIHPNDLGVTKEFLDKVCGRKGFAEALIHAGWLIEGEEGLSLPKFERHNGNDSKVRGLTARRVEKHRKTKIQTNAPAVTKKAKKKTEVTPEAPEVNDVIPELTVPEPLETNEILEVIDESSAHADDTPTTLAAASIEPIPEPVGAPLPEEPEVESEEQAPTPRKRRAKTEEASAEQPMLF